MMRARGDRGATSVEYALAIGLVVVAIIGSVQEAEQALSDEYDRSVAEVEELPGSDGYIDPDAVAGSSTTTSTTTTTVVDAGPTSTTSTTDPTASTTTTTTTIAPKAIVASLTDVSTPHGAQKWNASVTVGIRNNQTNDVLVGAVVRIRFYAANGSTMATSCSTGSEGTCTVTWEKRTHVHSPLLVTVTRVTATPEWDQVETSTHLQQP